MNIKRHEGEIAHDGDSDDDGGAHDPSPEHLCPQLGHGCVFDSRCSFQRDCGVGAWMSFGLEGAVKEPACELFPFMKTTSAKMNKIEHKMLMT